MSKIEDLINSIPEAYGALGVMPDIQKEFYLALFKIRLEQFKLLA